jgi:hypothetical protein
MTDALHGVAADGRYVAYIATAGGSSVGTFRVMNSASRSVARWR